MPSTRLRSVAVARRIVSFTGIVPLGAFLVLHAAVNVCALRGDASFAAAAGVAARLPALAALEALFVLVPLALHAAAGVWLLVNREPLREPSPYPRPIRTAMGATGAVALLFLALHVAELRFGPGSTVAAPPDGYILLSILEGRLSSTWHGIPLRAAAYLIGSGCVVFHCAAGAWALTTRWRAASERARRRAAWVVGTAGAIVWLLFSDVVVLHATGEPLFGPPPADQSPDGVPREACPPRDSSAH